MDDSDIDSDTEHDVTPRRAPSFHLGSDTTLRRTVLGVLLRAGRSMTVGELLHELERVGRAPHPLAPRTPRKALADLLAYQSRVGRLERVGRGRYRAVPSAMSASMRSRARRAAAAASAQSVVRNSSTVRSNAIAEAAAS